MFYGAAEFSRDTDLAILASPDNLKRLSLALKDMQAESIAVPPFDLEYLKRGHALHFRCHRPDVEGIRIDVMAKLRGLPPFPELWERRTVLESARGGIQELLSLPDLVQAKKTQRDKDWPMIRRLLEAHYFAHRESADPQQIRFWLAELRTPQLLIEVAQAHPSLCRKLAEQRSCLRLAEAADEEALGQALLAEEHLERAQDRQYWMPLKTELQELRRQRPRKGPIKE